MSKAILVVRIKGTINIPHPIERTLRELNLCKRFSATIVPDTPSYMGMLKKVKDYVAWCSIEPSFIETILMKRGKIEGDRPLSDEFVKKIGYESIGDLAKAIAEGKARLNKLDGIKPFFSLAPPRGGFKRSTKYAYTQGGVLGSNPELPNLVERML
ncbi:MAG: 50S ribosomal protein L30 [Nitrososphaerales archaeon]|nr:50S ribosomal protein L30 [Nitrososphaerales archaeon]